MRHIILISGKDSLATAIVQVARAPDLDYEFVHNDTGWDLPETLQWLRRVEAYLEKPLLRLGDDLTEICRRENCLPTSWRRFCTKYAKIQPLNDYLAGREYRILRPSSRFVNRSGLDTWSPQNSR